MLETLSCVKIYYCVKVATILKQQQKKRNTSENYLNNVFSMTNENYLHNISLEKSQ